MPSATEFVADAIEPRPKAVDLAAVAEAFEPIAVERFPALDWYPIDTA